MSIFKRSVFEANSTKHKLGQVLFAVSSILFAPNIFAAGSGTDFISFLGTLENTNINLTSPSGVAVSRSGEFRVNSSSYDGLGGIDYLNMSNKSDYLQSGSVVNVEVILAGSGDDILDVSGTNTGVTLIGSTGNDVIFGGDFNDTIRGNDDNDFLDGGEGNDIVDAGFGDDTVFGGGGDDLLISGPGTNILTGGAGRDAFTGTSYGTSSIMSIITDFSSDDFYDLSFMSELGCTSGCGTLDDWSNWLRTDIVGDDTILSLDALGSGGSFTPIASFENYTSGFVDLSYFSVDFGDSLYESFWGLGGVEAQSVPVPEPSTPALLVLGMISLWGMRRKQLC
ncbi:PEP-CTERM sorting domain-containing protein [Marinobacter salexigens]|uniref:PEP-CTERM sorting domain-containing protein n=1 Tax=Marinobacter salexigens TaxID=1925763 RepID=UPI000C283EF6|nr:PEP-CTERM sorting domain-containing protein [Marinobacter salexigens]